MFFVSFLGREVFDFLKKNQLDIEKQELEIGGGGGF